jgi:hypothetical protein
VRGGNTGNKGGAGTMYVKGPSSVYGDLTVDNSAVVGQSTILPALGSGVAQIGSHDAVLVADRTSIGAYFVGHWVDVSNATGEPKGTWRIASIGETSLTLQPNGTEIINIEAGDTWQGVYRFDSVTVQNNGKLQSADPVRTATAMLGAGSTEANVYGPLKVNGALSVVGAVFAERIEAQSLTVANGAVLSHRSGESLSIEVPGNVTIESGGSINVTGRGYGNGVTYPGVARQGNYSGGSHLGVGGVYSSGPAGVTYGSVYRPQEAGAGGRYDSDTEFTSGGGVLRMVVGGVVRVDGAIRANGGDRTGTGTGRGAGGSVWITAGSVTGGGSVEARGGEGYNYGAGGGGAVSIEHQNGVGVLLPTVLVRGGNTGNKGGAGTMYVKGPSSVYGDLTVDNSAVVGQSTILPSLGNGVAQAGSAGAKLVALLEAAPNGPVARWTFDEQSGSTASDASGGGNTATLANGAGWTSGHQGGALLLNGVDQYAGVSNSAAFDSMQRITLAAWIKPSRIISTRQEIVCFKEGDSPNVGALLALPEGDGSRVRMWVHIGGSWQSATSVGTIAVGDWHHVLGSYDGQTIRVYIDGWLQGSTSAAGTMSNGNQVVTIGARSPNRQYYFGGAIDDVQIYDRALSAEEAAGFRSVQPHFVGRWVEVRNAAGEVKGTWRIASIEGGSITLQPNGTETISIEAGDTWQGVYRFDSITAQGNAKVVFDDRVEIDPTKVTIASGSTITWYNATAPTVDAAKVSTVASSGAFRVTGQAGTIADPDGLGSALLRNLRTSTTWALALSSGGFGPIAVTGIAGDQIELEARDAHVRPRTTKVVVAALPANAGGPTITTSLISVGWQSNALRATGAAASVVDPELPITLKVTNSRTGTQYSGVAAADGSFSILIDGTGGDAFTLTATDSHPQPLSSTADIGTLQVTNTAPIVSASLITLTYEGPIQGEGYEPPAYQVSFAAGAIADDFEGYLTVRVVDGRDGSTWSESVDVTKPSGGTQAVSSPFWIRLHEQVNAVKPERAAKEAASRAAPQPGDPISLSVVDEGPGAPLTTTVDLGVLPADNYGPPEVATDNLQLLPLGYGYQILGRASAVTDVDGVAHVVAYNAAAGWTSQEIPVASDGSFWLRVVGTAGQLVELVATDAHPQQPLSTPHTEVGALPAAGLATTTVELGGHSISGLRGWTAFVDDGHAASWPTLRGQPNQETQENLGELITGLGQARDSVFSGTSENEYVLDGGDLVPIACGEAHCPLATPGRLTVAGQPLATGIALGGTLFLAGEGATPQLVVLAEPTVDHETGAITATCAPTSLALPGIAGLHILEALPGHAGQVALLLDNPSGELLVLNVADPESPNVVGTSDLDGTATPIWATWANGELFLGRNDGSVELWRWGNTALELYARVNRSGQTSGAARTATQLWIGTEAGTVEQYDLSEPAQPVKVGELTLGAPVIAVADLESSFLVATTAGLTHVWASVMPPEINPDGVHWGNSGAYDWARVQAINTDGIDRVEVCFTGDCSESWCSGWDGDTLLCGTDSKTPPAVRAFDSLGLGSGIYQPSLWQSWGGWDEQNKDASGFPSTEQLLAPTDCGVDRGTFGVASTSSAGDVPWIAMGNAGGTNVDFVPTFLEPLPNISATGVSLPISGPLSELVSFDGLLYVADSGLGIWSVADPTAPALVSHTDLFGAADVSAVELVSGGSEPFELLLAGGNPGALVRVTGSTRRAPTIADAVALPSLVGQVVDLARAPGGPLFVLAEDAGSAHLYAYDLTTPSAPQLVTDKALLAGVPAVAIDVLEGEESSVLVVRAGVGLEVYSSALDLVRSVPLTGQASDVSVVYVPWAEQQRAYVTLGFGSSVAEVSGLPAEPFVQYISTPGEARRFAARGISSSAFLEPSSERESAAMRHDSDGEARWLTPRGFYVYQSTSGSPPAYSQAGKTSVHRRAGASQPTERARARRVVR